MVLWRYGVMHLLLVDIGMTEYDAFSERMVFHCLYGRLKESFVSLNLFKNKCIKVK